ncbi:MAG: tetratricopeptide repeat protein, partial [Rhodocyclaceae bacterium]|nr:tetratricopeptide repeat protein [Rhodocyclaceae bacterium]
MNHFVFFHVGPDLSEPSALVASIRHFMPHARITQCSDSLTPAVEFVDEVVRVGVNPDFLMLGRTAGFAKVQLQALAVFLDTDMLLLAPLEVPIHARTLLCRRSFDRDRYFNAYFRGMDFSEYAGKTLDEVYPILACFTATSDPKFWAQCHARNLRLPGKFHRWYGDQEVLREEWRTARPGDIAVVDEREFACLPEKNEGQARILHFKGSERKSRIQESLAALLNTGRRSPPEPIPDPLERAKTLFLQASESLQRGESEAAAADFERALKLAPGHLGIMVALGAAYVSLERFDDARRQCDAVLEQGLG